MFRDYLDSAMPLAEWPCMDLFEFAAMVEETDPHA
jgi:hypothetical protein